MSSSPQDSIASICEAFLKLEQTHKLFDWEIEGVWVWKLLRMPLYYRITQELGVFGAPHGTSRTKGRRWAIMRLWSYAAASLLLRRKNPTEVLIFDHPRKVPRGNFEVDLYTEGLIEALQKRGISMEVYENLSYLNHTREARDHPRRYYDLIVTLARFALKLSPLKLSSPDHERIRHIEEGFKTELGVSIKISAQVKKLTRDFQIRARIYRRLLQAHQPKLVVVVVSYSPSILPLIFAAKSLGIPTAELQHGTFSPYHLGYHHPHQETHPYFCDTFLSFGEFWKQMANLPLLPHQIKVLGFRHLYEQIASSRSEEPRANRPDVLFLSQGVIGEGLARYAIACARAPLTWRLVYKLHPSEYQTWRDDYPELSVVATQGLIEVIDHSRAQLYDLMKSAYYQVGVFSTAIYEGLALGCHTLLIDLPGIEYMAPLIERGRAEHIKSPLELVECLEFPHKEGVRESLPTASKVGDEDEVFASLQETTVDWLIERHLK